MEPKEKVENDFIEPPSQTMLLTDNTQAKYASSIGTAYCNKSVPLEDDTLLDVADIQVYISSDFSSLKTERGASDSCMSFSVHKKSDIESKPRAILQLKGFTIPDQHIETSDSILQISGSTSLSEQVLDLIFDWKPFSNFSSMLYDLDDFAPDNKMENILLLGLLKRSIILFGTKTIPSKISRYTDVDALNTVANEFVLSLFKYNQCDLLLQLLETTVIASNHNSNILRKYALLLDKMSNYNMALEYLILSADLSEACHLYFLIIRIYYEHFHDFDSGIAWCHKALKLKQVRSDARFKSKCYLYLGIGCLWKLMRNKDIPVLKSRIFINKQNNLSITKSEKDDRLFDSFSSDSCFTINPEDVSISEIVLSESETRIQIDDEVSKLHSPQSPLGIAMSHIIRAAKYDCKNPVVYYYLSLICAQRGNMKQAISYVKHALELNVEHLPSLHLLVLLQSSYDLLSAQSLLESIVSEYPDHVELHMTQAHISLALENFVNALKEMREALMIWNTVHGHNESNTGYLFDDNDSGLFSVNRSDSPFLYSDMKKSSLVEIFYNHMIKIFVSSTICFNELPDKKQLLLDIWSMFARIYLALNLEQDFVHCLSEMLNICDVTIPYLGSIEQSTVEPMSGVLSHSCTEILLHLGLYYQKTQDLTKAKSCFNYALSISPSHMEVLYQLSCIEKDSCLLNSALLTTLKYLKFNNVGNFKAKLYFLMGEIYDGLGESENALVAYKMALVMNESMPVCSYDIIPHPWE